MSKVEEERLKRLEAENASLRSERDGAQANLKDLESELASLKVENASILLELEDRGKEINRLRICLEEEKRTRLALENGLLASSMLQNVPQQSVTESQQQQPPLKESEPRNSLVKVHLQQEKSNGVKLLQYDPAPPMSTQQRRQSINRGGSSRGLKAKPRDSIAIYKASKPKGSAKFLPFSGINLGKKKSKGGRKWTGPRVLIQFKEGDTDEDEQIEEGQGNSDFKDSVSQQQRLPQDSLFIHRTHLRKLSAKNKKAPNQDVLISIHRGGTEQGIDEESGFSFKQDKDHSFRRVRDSIAVHKTKANKRRAKQ